MKLVAAFCLLLVSGLCAAVEEVEEEEVVEEEKGLLNPSLAVCKDVCHPSIGDCVDQGEGFFVCIPKTSPKKIVWPYRTLLAKPYRTVLAKPYRTHLGWPYRTHLGWPYRTHLGWPYRTHLNWPYHSRRFIVRRPAYGFRSTIIRPTYGVRSFYGIRPAHVIKPIY